MGTENEAEARIRAALALGFSAKAILERETGDNAQAFADKYGTDKHEGFTGNEVRMCLNPKAKSRVYPRIREAYARALGVSRELIDEVLDGEPVAQSA